MRRSKLALALGLLVAACSSGGTTNNNSGTISLGLNPSTGTIPQGRFATTVATLTRGGGFTGTVNLTVTGAPPGVTATVSNAVTTGTTTTATITIQVAASTVTGFYAMTVLGTGTGVTDATDTYLLTVTTLPAVAVALSASTLSIVQGAATPTATVTLTRTNFAGPVILSVDNLPTGVTASFAPANPQSGNSSVLTLTVAPTAPTGTFTNLAVRAAGSGITDATAPLTLTITAAAPAPSFTLSLTQAALSMAPGTSTPTTTVNINRVNFPGDVALSVLNLPTGVTAAFAPANPQSGTNSVLTLTVGAGVTPGVYNLSVQGVGTPGTQATPLTLTVTGDFNLTTTPATSVSVTQGGAGVPVTVNINHTGGNTSSITLTTTSATALPAGLTLGAFSANPTTAATSSFTITAAGSVPLGAYPIVIHGDATGLAQQTVNLTINVVAPSGSGNVTVSFAACAAAKKAVWLAFMDGTAGSWTQVTGAADVYQFNISQSKGSLAWVQLAGPDPTIEVLQETQAELTAGTISFCNPGPPTVNFLAGHALSIPSTFPTVIAFGPTSTTVIGVGGPQNFTLANPQSGTFDLIGFFRPGIAGTGKAFVKRAETPVGVDLPTLVDFQNGALTAPIDLGAATLTGLHAGETAFQTGLLLTGGSSACVPSLLYADLPITASFNMFGVPASLRVGSDLHRLNISANDNTLNTLKLLTENFSDVPTRVASPIIMPADLPIPVVTDAGGPYLRPMAVVTGVPAEFNLSHSLIINDEDKLAVVSATAGWVGGSNVTVTLPNFSGVGSFNNAWAPATGDQIGWTVRSAGATSTNSCAAGYRSVTSAKGGVLN